MGESGNRNTPKAAGSTGSDATQMKRTWTIIGVGDVAASFKWYQCLFGQPETRSAHDDSVWMISNGAAKGAGSGLPPRRNPT